MENAYVVYRYSIGEISLTLAVACKSQRSHYAHRACARTSSIRL